jgi:ElaB/YqjD/DUF883 family membrane-anchored ribosome-binding protein
MAIENSGDETKSPEEIQREIHETQRRLGDTLDAIQQKLTPRRLTDQVMHMFSNTNHSDRDGHGATDAVRENALPLAMIGLGIGWLMWSATGYEGADRIASTGRKARNWTGSRVDEARERMSDAGHAIRRRAEQMRGSRHDNLPDRPRDAYGEVRGAESGSGAGTYEYEYPGQYHYHPAGNSRSEGYSGDRGGDQGGGRGYADRARDYYEESRHRYGERAHEYGDRARRYGRAASRRAREGYDSFWHLAEEHPLMTGLMGFALGAAVGAAIPSTRYEDDLMGDYSDQLWDRGRNLGEDYYERAGDVARHAAEAGFEAAKEAGREEADRQGLTGQQAQEGEEGRRNDAQGQGQGGGRNGGRTAAGG